MGDLREKDYQHVDTNNLLECWFRTLKRYRLENRKLRVDFVIHRNALIKTSKSSTSRSNMECKPVKLSVALDLEEAKGMVRENMIESK
ncbi:hypothetical protein BGZ65_010938, partial [Modicella reniformis]